MRIRPLWLVLTLAGVALACGESPPPVATAASDIQSVAAPTATARVPVRLSTAVATPYDQHVQPVADPTATPNVQPVSDSGLDNVSPPMTYREARNQLGGGSALLRYTGPESIEELILTSDTIIRGSLLSVTTTPDIVEAVSVWTLHLEFRFRALEYLKGSGPTEIVAIASGGHYDTEAEARANLSFADRFRDRRWEDREAILFLRANWKNDPSFTPADRFYMGGLALRDGEDAYTVSSRHSKKWLPAAQPLGGRSTIPDSAKLFLLDAPATGTSGSGARSAAASGSPTISLVNMRTLVNNIEAEANAGGTEEYRQCVHDVYRLDRIMRLTVSERGRESWRKGIVAFSGQPAGTALHEEKFGAAKSQEEVGRHWFEGADADLIGFKAIRFTPYERYVGFDQQFVTTRPLPAGSYHFYYNFMDPWQMLCNKRADIDVNLWQYDLTVERPADVRVTHEAFFDPVAIGAAVGADASNGVLSPSTAVLSLKWESGTVTMEIDPSTAVSGHAVDLIALDGSVTTTLALDDATQSGGTLTWSVATQPWNAGDLLMLRIHKPVSNDATLSNLALSGVDLTFDPATTTYAASVPATTTQTTVTLTLNHDDATYVVKLGGVVDDDGTIPLAVGANVISVEITAEDGVTTETYTVTITRATPSSPVTVTLIPRVNGLTFFDIDIQWSHSGTCDNYYVAIITDANYQISFLGFHPPETSSHYVEGSWLYNNVPDFWVVVECRTSGDSQEVGRASLRAAHPDNN